MKNNYPLEGIKILDFHWVGAGPWATSFFADFGATVIRCESSVVPDPFRVTPPFKDGKMGLNASYMFNMLNSNKMSLCIDMKNEKAMEVIRPLLEEADIVCENMRPGAMERWGLSYEKIKEINPYIIMVSSCMQGQTGPRNTMSGFGLHLSALGGWTSITGWKDRPGIPPHQAYTDCIAPVYEIIAILAALEHRRLTGEGMYIDQSQLESGMSLLSVPMLDYTVNSHITELNGNRDPKGAPHGVYPCRGEDRWIAIEVFSDEEWDAFCDVLGKPDWTKEERFSTFIRRKRNEDALEQLVALETSKCRAEELMAKLQTAGVGAGIVETGRDVLEDPQFRARKFFLCTGNNEMGDALRFGPALKFNSCEPKEGYSPCIGEHNEYVCKEILKMSDEKYQELIDAGVFV
jgi:benzylsuccinate CoA-transferase BbsF subunit